MRRKQVWRYWCDHCSKGGCSGGHIAKHERRCIKNPQRECGMCKHAGDVEQSPMVELMAALDNGGLELLTDTAEQCPACILAAIVQARIRDKAAGVFDEETDYIEFDYKAASTAFLNDVNEAKNREDQFR